MKTTSIVFCLLAGSAIAADRGLTIGAGRPDVSALSLLAKDLPPPVEPAHTPSVRAKDITLSTVPYVADRTDLIATVSDQQRVLRSVHIDPAPRPPASPAEAETSGRPLGNAERKH